MKRLAIVPLLVGVLVGGAMLLGLSLGESQAVAGSAGLRPYPPGPFRAGEQAGDALNCRLGLAAWDPAFSQVDPAQWGTGWYLTFGAEGLSHPTMEFLHVVRVRQDKYWNGSTWVYSDTFRILPPLSDAPGGLGPIIAAHPGSWWAIGSEPDRGPDPGSPDPGYQEATFPAMYARTCHDVYHFPGARSLGPDRPRRSGGGHAGPAAVPGPLLGSLSGGLWGGGAGRFLDLPPLHPVPGCLRGSGRTTTGRWSTRATFSPSSTRATMWPGAGW